MSAKGSRSRIRGWIGALGLLFVAVADGSAQVVVTGIVARSGGLEISWTSPTVRNLVSAGPTVNGPYLFLTPVLFTNAVTVSNAAPASFFRVQRVALISIPDTNLANAVRNAITNKWEPADEFYDFELATVTNITVIDRGVSNVTGLEASGLAVLDLSLNGRVTDLSPLAGLTNMTRLYLGDNLITNIAALAGMASLTRLEIYKNLIGDVSPLAGMSDLGILLAYQSSISNLAPLVGLTNMTQLYLNDNHIENISPLGGMASLTYLNLNNNRITNVEPLSALTNLYRLWLTNNLIQEIGALVTNALQGGFGTGDIIYLRGNPLSSFALTNDIPLLTNHGATVYYNP